MKKLILEPYCDRCPFFEAETLELYYHDNRLVSDHHVMCRYKHQCAFAVEKYKELQKERSDANEND